MAADETTLSIERVKEESPWVGVIVLVVFLLVLWGIGRGLVAWVREYRNGPPPVIALSAYFADDSGNPVTKEDTPSHLKIVGQISRTSKALADGKVRLTVGTLDQAFQQTIIVDLKDGNFGSEDAALRKLDPGDQIYVKAEVLSAELSETPSEELYLNTKPPKITSDTLWEIVIGFLVVVFMVFFYAFTGKKTPLKNRTAIIFSYCVIGIFLILPLLAPVLLVPNDRRGMIAKPVGLVLTRIGSPQDGKVQWAVNIGGYATAAAVVAPSPSPSPQATKAPPSSPRASAQVTKTPSSSAASPSPQATTSPQPSRPAATPAETQTPRARAAAVSTVSPSPSATETPQPGPTTETQKENDLVVDVQGGLVIPLYVIILSVIGGAINMTRKVPRLQEEGERSEISVRPALRSAYDRIRHPLGGKSDSSVGNQSSGNPPPTGNPPPSGNPPPTVPSSSAGIAEKTDDDKATEIDTKLEQLLASYSKSDNDAQARRKEIRNLVDDMQRLFESSKTGKPILGFDSFDDWMKDRPALKELLTPHWRVELLYQYMYLMSAPFLAIVAYYMLDLLGLTKMPILVLIAFSVGLISEKILSWLLGLASGYLKSDTNQSSAAR